MVLMLIGSTVFGIILGFLLAHQTNPQKIKDDPLDRWERTRKIARDKGLILHMDSYLNGVELYVPKSHENLPYEKVKHMGLRV